MLNRAVLGVGILAFARAATAAAAVLRFGPSLFSLAFALEAVVLAGGAFALARSPARGRRAAAGAFVATAFLQTVPFGLGLARGVNFLSLGDILFIGGMLGAAWAALHASVGERATRPAPDVAAHLAVAACGPLVWTLTNAAMGRFDFTFTSALALAGVSLAAWAFARAGHDAAEGTSPAVGA